MPIHKKLKALVLLSTLKHGNASSNTYELSQLVCKNLGNYDISCEIVRLVDLDIKAGLNTDMGDGDEWPAIEKKIRDCSILICATPIWWGIQSSVMQRAIERMDALDEEYRKTGISPLYNKVAGIIVTGSEDGAQHIIGNLCNFLQWSGFTLPPECAAYWVGEVGQDPQQDANRRRNNKATNTMAQRMARNLAYYANLLYEQPLKIKK
jgi:multimeric flavodoxin WrbA